MIKIKNIFVTGIALAALAVTMLLAMASCGGRGTNERIIAVSIQPQRYLLEQLVGKHFKVVCLLAQGSNPEAYEPSMRHLMNLEKSEAYFCIGNIGFELAIVEKAKQENPDLKLYDNSKGVPVIRGGHDCEEHGHNHEIDPHTWTSARNAVIIAQNMHDALVELDPKHTADYDRNFAALKAHLEALDGELAAKLRGAVSRTFLVWHPSLSYFARDYGLQQISMEYNGKEAPVAHLKAEIDAARESGARVFFYQKEFDTRQIATINEQIGARLVTINPMNYEWEEELRNIADALATEENN
ncbi:MAG: metal ABC transporter solute-binding protein, Zn/Mn family [Muribaculaceae bacterium]